jgi:hypothetical protein
VGPSVRHRTSNGDGRRLAESVGLVATLRRSRVLSGRHLTGANRSECECGLLQRLRPVPLTRHPGEHRQRSAAPTILASRPCCAPSSASRRTSPARRARSRSTSSSRGTRTLPDAAAPPRECARAASGTLSRPRVRRPARGRA